MTGAVHYYGTDGHGSVRFLTDTNGTITDTYLYDSYGNLIPSNTVTVNAYLYCGEQYDSDLGMYYLRARYYQPQTGRFWTMDTDEGNYFDPLSLHEYLYCEDNSITHADPNGHADLVDVLVAGALAGTIAAIGTPYTANAPGPNDVTYPAITEGEILGSFISGFTFGVGGYFLGEFHPSDSNS